MDLVSVLLSVLPVPIDFEDIKGSARGYFSPIECRIAIQQGMSEADTIKTILHEQSHVWLHAKGAEEETADQRTREVEAESIASAIRGSSCGTS